MKLAEIRRRFGPDGITGYSPAYGGLGKITDDTQMTLFTAEGLLRAWVRGCFRGITTFPGVTANAYLRWLRTQGEQPICDVQFDAEKAGWLFQHRQLHSQRAPGNTCLAALKSMESLGQPARNDSKGCGRVMRVAPVGLFAWNVPSTTTPPVRTTTRSRRYCASPRSCARQARRLQQSPAGCISETFERALISCPETRTHRTSMHARVRYRQRLCRSRTICVAPCGGRPRTRITELVLALAKFSLKTARQRRPPCCDGYSRASKPASFAK